MRHLLPLLIFKKFACLPRQTLRLGPARQPHRQENRQPQSPILRLRRARPAHPRAHPHRADQRHRPGAARGLCLRRLGAACGQTRVASTSAAHADGAIRTRQRTGQQPAATQFHSAQRHPAEQQRLPVGRQPAAARNHQQRAAAHLRARTRELCAHAAY